MRQPKNLFACVLAAARISWFFKTCGSAALSVPLNLAEGSGKSSPKDLCRFYQIALGSLREVQTILELHGNAIARNHADQTGALVFRLVQALKHSSFK